MTDDEFAVVGVLTLGPTTGRQVAETLGWTGKRTDEALARLQGRGCVVVTRDCCSERLHDTYGLIHGTVKP